MGVPTQDVLAQGAEVEVRTRFDGRWVRGYAVESVEDAGIRLARLRDRQVLPALFASEEVRVAASDAGAGGPARVA
ncbi:MAG TPA: hypothetical protein VFH45_12295 [Acidimicrobiales bacterium]|nr:hypothetical protein [Acidimicrobiales bacterium]